MAPKILIVDDEGLVIRSLDRLLKKDGYQIIAVATADEAVSEIKKSNFDLIITDIRMPGKNGVQMIQEVRSLLVAENRKKIPEIVITGYADEETSNEMEKLGVAEYIYKPFDIRQFLELVRKHVKMS